MNPNALLQTALPIGNVTYGVVASLVGGLFLFFGIRLFSPVISAAGFALGSLACYVLLSNVHLHYYSLGAHSDLIIIVACIVAGLVGALLSLILWRATLIGIGALGGFAAAMYILNWNLPYFPPPSTARYGKPIIVVVFSALGAVSTVFFERLAVIVGTACFGAVALCSGVDVFATTGFNEALQAAIVNSAPHKMPPEHVSMLAACAVVAILGILMQYTVTGAKVSSITRKD